MEIGAFAENYNRQRYHKSLNNLTPEDVYMGRDKTILSGRQEIQRETLRQRRNEHLRALSN